MESVKAFYLSAYAALNLMSIHVMLTLSKTEFRNCDQTENQTRVQESECLTPTRQAPHSRALGNYKRDEKTLKIIKSG